MYQNHLEVIVDQTGVLFFGTPGLYIYYMST